MLQPKKIKLDMTGLYDGNAFMVLGRFKHEALDQGWTEEEVDKVLTEAQSFDYKHLIATIEKHVER